MNGDVQVSFSRQEAQVLAAVVSNFLAPPMVLEQPRRHLVEAVQFKLEQAIMAGQDEPSSSDLSVTQ